MRASAQGQDAAVEGVCGLSAPRDWSTPHTEWQRRTRATSDMRTASIVTHRHRAEERAHSRFRENLRQAGLEADATDDAILNAISRQVAEGHATFDQANNLILKVRADQRARDRAVA